MRGRIRSSMSPGRRLAVALLLVALPRMAASAEPAMTATAADTVLALESARAQALLSADTTALARMTADEFIEISRLGQIRTKADNLNDIRSGALKLTAIQYDSLTVQVYGTVAILRGLADNTGTFRGFPFAGKIRYTRIFVRRGDRWQAVGMQHTPLP